MIRPVAFVLILVQFCPILLAQTPDTTAGMRQRIDVIRKQLPGFAEQINALRARGDDVAYPLVTYTVLDNFTGYAKDDLNISIPDGWGIVGLNGCDVKSQPVRDAHAGEWATRIVNNTPAKPNVYGMFENTNGDALTAGKTYTLSIWAKCD